MCGAALGVRLCVHLAHPFGFRAPPKGGGPGHPGRGRVGGGGATLRQCVREGTPWRRLKATAGMVSGSTLRRHLEQWARLGVLAQVQAVLVGRGAVIRLCFSIPARYGPSGVVI